MLRVTGAKLFCALTALITLISTAKIAEAGALHTPVLPAWGRPTTNAQAVATSSTYQEWDAPSPTGEVPGPSSPLAAQAFVNPNANNTTQAVWYDSSASTDDAFQVGTDVYSFDGIISPVVVVPGYNKSDSQLNVSVEVQTFGGTIDTNALTATYTDPSGNAQSFLVSTLPSFSYSQAYNDGGTPFGAFGTAYVIDNLWTFTLPQDTASLTLSFGWGVTSSALQALSVDTSLSSASTGPSLPGDLNDDGIVNSQDLALVASSWMASGKNVADVNGDGIVNSQDLAIVSSNWLKTDGSTSNAVKVPEPSALMLAALGGLALLAWRRR